MSSIMQVQLITTSDTGEPVISSLCLCEGLGIAHRVLIATVRKHIDDVRQFGRVLFQKAPLKTKGGTQRVTFVNLNENQSLFVGSLSNNSAQVVKFKATLVREFDHARKTIEAAQRAIHVPQINLIAQVAKLERKLDLIRKERTQYLRAKLIERHQRNQQEQKKSAAKERDQLFNLLEQYVKVHTFQTADTVVDRIIDKIKWYYKLDLTIQTRVAGEHYFDVAIKLGMGYCVTEVIKCHMYKSSDLK